MDNEDLYCLTEMSFIYFTDEGKTHFSPNLVIEKDFNYEAYLADYKLLDKLGKGGFGTVYLGEHKLTKEQYSIKIIESDSSSYDQVNN